MVCIIAIYYYYVNKSTSSNMHLFWNSSQPIFDVLKKDSIIKNVNDLRITNPGSDMEIIEFNKNTLDVFIKFINKNYNQSANQTPDYIDFNCSPKHKLYGLKKSNELIGTISGKYTKMNINNSEVNCIYVDYLCIQQKYRDNNYAPILISCIIKEMKNINYPIAFYRLDNKKHHFKHFYVNSYYYYDFKNYNKGNDTNNDIVAVTLDKNNTGLVKDLYDFYKKEIAKFSIYEILDLHAFTIKLKNNLSTTLIFMEDDKIVSFITYLDVKYNIFDDVHSVAELFLFIYGGKSNVTKIIESFIKNIKDKYSYLYLLNNYFNNNIVENINMTKTEDTFFYIYNYYLADNYTINNCIMY
jgi:hypothetical protein